MQVNAAFKTSSRAFVEGWRRLSGGAWLLVSVWLMTIVVSAPLALALHGMIGDHLGSSLAAESATRGVNFDWWNEFLAQAAGVGQTFVPRIIGFAAVLGNLSGLADANRLATIPAGAIGTYLLVSTFLAGGILDRLARNRAVGAAGFFSACGVFFFRFLRLGILVGIVYWLLFTRLHPLLFDRLLSSWTHDLTVERTAFGYRALLYLVFGLVVLAVNLIVDYTKVRAVVEDRRSMVMALVAAFRFVRRNPGATLLLYLLNFSVFVVVLLFYYLAAPSASAPLWVALVTGQLFILLRVAVRLQFAASQIALFQGRLAHAQYTATPTPTWPDSPAAEAIKI